jgi:uncharacterized protein YegP (UPF0339 family)
MDATFTIEPGHPGVFRYILRRSDGDVLVTSEPFPTEDDAREGIEQLRRCVATARVEPTDHGPAQGRHVHPHEHPRDDLAGRRTIGPDDASTS